MKTGAKLGCVLSIVLAHGVVVTSAAAQSAADKAAAEGLFDQGRASMREGDFSKACGLLERSQRIDPAVGTLLYLAECYEKSGRTASAWATFREAADAADAARDAGRSRTGRERAQRLEPLLSRLTIQVAPENQDVRGLVIERRDMQVQQAVWNVPVPADPGEYKITASAPGYETWSGMVTVPERAGRVSVTIPPLKKAAESEPASATPTVAPFPTGPGPEKTADDSSVLSLKSSPPPAEASAQRTAAYVLGAAGVVGLGIGSYFGIRAIGKNGDVEDRCPTEPCSDAQAATSFDDAKSAARFSNVAFGLGAAALIGGAVLYFTSPAATPTSSSTRLRAAALPGGVVLEGTFQ